MARRWFKKSRSVGPRPELRSPRLDDSVDPATVSASDDDAAPRPGPARDETTICDDYGLMEHLCKPDHMLHNATGRRLRDACVVCNEVKSEAKIVCANCTLVSHFQCREQIHVPCIYPTPIDDIEQPNLAQCTAAIPKKQPKVPAILVKCFHELQKSHRITRQDIITSVPYTSDERVAIDELSEKLRRHVNWDLSDVPTPVISGCVKKFLSDIKNQLMVPELEQAIFDIGKTLLGYWDDDLVSKVTTMLKEFDRPRRHTLAALFVHLHTIYKYKDQNRVTEQSIGNAFRLIFRPMKILFRVDPERFWIPELTS